MVKVEEEKKNRIFYIGDYNTYRFLKKNLYNLDVTDVFFPNFGTLLLCLTVFPALLI